MPENSPDTQPTNPALKELGVLIGNWNMDVFNASFLPNPSDVMPGVAENLRDAFRGRRLEAMARRAQVSPAL